MDWSRHVCIVTGGGRGIGAATVRLFNEKGAAVLATARSSDELESVRASCSDPARVLAIPGDISDATLCERLFRDAEANFGPVTTLFNNAATLIKAEILNVAAGDLETTLKVNVQAPFFLTQLAFRAMKRHGRGGAIINVSSLAGISGTDKFSGFSTYCMSKFAITGLTEASAVEGRPLGIRVNCLAPGAVATKMLRDNAPFIKTNTGPDDVAKLVLFLADESQSGALTGSVIPIMSNL